MNSTPTDFWVALTTVAPVLGLALVVEGRQRWDTMQPDFSRSFLAVMHGACLLLLLPTITQALQALRGEDVSDKWADFGLTAVSFSIGILIGSPALALFLQGSAGGSSWLLSFASIRGLRTLSLRLAVGRAMRRVAAQRIRNYDLFVRTGLSVEQASGLLTALSHLVDEPLVQGERREDLMSKRAEGQRLLAEVRQHHVEAERQWRETIRYELDRRAHFAHGLAELRKHGAGDRARRRDLWADALGGSTPVRRETSAEISEPGPDDGGFFPARMEGFSRPIEAG